MIVSIWIVSAVLVAFGHDAVATSVILAPQGDSTETRIFGGAEAFPGEFPYIVSLEINSLHTCAGAILSEFWILTAGDCVGSPMRTNVIAGAIDLNILEAHSQIFGIEKVILHPEYDPTKVVNNVALVKLDGEITFNNFIQPIQIITDKEFEKNTKGSGLALLAGWGANEESVLSRRLKLGTTFIKDPELCYADSNNGTCNSYDPLSNICTDPLAALDTGGPLVVRGKVAGIIIRGAKERRRMPCHNFDHYVKITQYTPFIKPYIPEIFPEKNKTVTLEKEQGIHFLIVITDNKSNQSCGESSASEEVPGSSESGSTGLPDSGASLSKSTESSQDGFNFDFAYDFIFGNDSDSKSSGGSNSGSTSNEDANKNKRGGLCDATTTIAPPTLAPEPPSDWAPLYDMIDFNGFDVNIYFKEVPGGDDDSNESLNCEDDLYKSDIPSVYYEQSMQTLKANPNAEPTMLVVLLSNLFRGNRAVSLTDWCQSLLMPNELGLSLRALLV